MPADASTTAPSTLRGRLKRAAIGVLSVLAVPPMAAACDPDLGRVVSRLPADIEFVAALDNGATLRKGLGNSPVMLALASMRRPALVLDAWSQLAADLGMTDAEAFDLLLGRRVVFAARGLQTGDAQTQWALLSELDPVTERRLRADLGAIPRRVVAGQPVLELEHGSFLLATSSGRLRCADDGRFETSTASAIMLLAPAEDRALFESLLPLLHCQTPASSLAATPGGAAAAAGETGDAVFLWRMPDPASSPDRFLVGSIRFGTSRYDLHMIAGPARGWIPETDITSLDSWSPRMLDTLPGNPSLAVIGLRSSVREARNWITPLLPAGVPDTEQPSIEDLLGDRSMLAVWLRPELPGEHTPDVEVLMALESRDLDALAERGDALLGAEEPPAAPPAGALQRRFAPSEVRSMQFVSPADLQDETPATLNWAYVRDERETPRPEGWWVLHFDPAGSAARAETDSSPDVDPHDPLPARRYLHVGRASPVEFAARSAAGADQSSPGTVRVIPTLLAQVRSLQWSVWVDQSGDLLEADLSLRSPAHPAPAPAPAKPNH